MENITYKPIGIIHSPFKEIKGIPIQPKVAQDTAGKIEIFENYTDGLKDLAGFSHIILLYHFHLLKNTKLIVKPYMDDALHGVFSTRAPSRPNPIGLSIVRLTKITDNMLYVVNIDIVDNTPLLDIKPYVPQFDAWKANEIGWLEKNIDKLPNTRDDGRFTTN